MESQTLPLRRTDVLKQEVSGTLVLLDPDSGQYFALDEVGARIWDLCDGDRTFASIADLIGAEYDAPAAEIRADVSRLLGELAGERLLVLRA